MAPADTSQQHGGCRSSGQYVVPVGAVWRQEPGRTRDDVTRDRESRRRVRVSATTRTTDRKGTDE